MTLRRANQGQNETVRRLLMNKALLLTYYFPPSAASGTHRLLGLAQFLPQFGWEIGVIAPQRVPWESFDEGLLARVPEKTRAYRTNFPSGWLSKPIRKLFPYGVWLPLAIRSLQKAYREFPPDVILTSGPPHCVHLAGLVIKRLYGTPWVADFRDPWITGNYEPSRRWDRLFGSHWERLVFRNADAIVVNAPNAKHAIERRYPHLAEKTHTITNGFDPTQFAGLSRTREPEKITVSHVGELYGGRDPRPVFDALALLERQSPEYRERFVVEFIGVDEGLGLTLQAQAKACGMKSMVRTVAHVPYRESLQRMVNADILLLLDTPGRVLGVPAKLYEYLGAKRPVLVLAEADGDVAWVVRRSTARYEMAHFGNPPEIARGLAALITPCSLSAPQSGCEHFTRNAIANQMAALFDSLAKPPLLPIAA